MRIRTGFCLAFIFGFLSLPSLAPAYTAQALAQYQAGRQYQAAHQWAEAVRAYEAAMQADPSLVAANKDLGAVYYHSGDRKGALYYYDRYLAAYPNDTATRTFADSLRAPAAVVAPVPTAPAAAEAAPSAGPFNPGFDVRGSLGAVMASGADVNEFYGWDTQSINPGGTRSGPGGVTAQGYEVGADYGFSNGFVVGLDVLDGPIRTDNATLTYPDGGGGTVTEKDTYNISQFGVLLTPGWRFRLGKSFVIEPRLGLGIMLASWNFAQNYSYDANALANDDEAYFSNATYSATGSGYAIWPELRAEYLFGQFGLGLSVGYLLNTNTEMRYTNGPTGINVGNPVGYIASPADYEAGTTTTWYLNTSGFSASIYGVWHFQPLF